MNIGCLLSRSFLHFRYSLAMIDYLGQHLNANCMLFRHASRLMRFSICYYPKNNMADQSIAHCSSGQYRDIVKLEPEIYIMWPTIYTALEALALFSLCLFSLAAVFLLDIHDLFKSRLFSQNQVWKSLDP